MSTDSGQAAGSESGIEPAAPAVPTPLQPPSAEMIGGALADAARRAGLAPDEGTATGHVVLRAMGGVRGIVESVLPGLIFVVVYTLTFDAERESGDLPLSLGLSVGLAILFTLVRLVTRSPAAPAIGGLVATVGAALLSLWTGRGEDNFVIGLLTNGVYGTAFLVSALAGWSLIGLAAGFLMGEATAWRGQRRKRIVFFWLAIAWAGLFVARLAVQLPLYFAGETVALATFKLIMGVPLFAPLLAVTWLAVRALYRKDVRSPE